jgi:hypothetical protein
MNNMGKDSESGEPVTASNNYRSTGEPVDLIIKGGHMDPVSFAIFFIFFIVHLSIVGLLLIFEVGQR